MTSISSSASAPMPFVQQALQRDVAAGSISATDQTALTAAIGDIAIQLQAGGTSATTGTAAAGTTPPMSMKDRVDGLIDDQVTAGKLTGDQASELKGAFAQAHAHMHGAHGHHGGGGAVQSLLASLTDQSSADPTTTDPITGTSATSSTTATSTTSTSTTAASTPPAATATTAVAALEAFLNQFKAAIGANGTYGANGQASTSPLSVLVNSIG